MDLDRRFRDRIGVWPYEYYIYLCKVQEKTAVEAFQDVQQIVDDLWYEETSYYYETAEKLFGG